MLFCSCCYGKLKSNTCEFIDKTEVSDSDYDLEQEVMIIDKFVKRYNILDNKINVTKSHEYIQLKNINGIHHLISVSPQK